MSRPLHNVRRLVAVGFVVLMMAAVTTAIACTTGQRRRQAGVGAARGRMGAAVVGGVAGDLEGGAARQPDGAAAVLAPDAAALGNAVPVPDVRPGPDQQRQQVRAEQDGRRRLEGAGKDDPRGHDQVVGGRGPWRRIMIVVGVVVGGRHDELRLRQERQRVACGVVDKKAHVTT
jgi:hypothetical protein